MVHRRPLNMCVAKTKAFNLQLLVSVRNLQQQHSSSKYSVKSYESNSGKVYDGVVDR